ncbi:glycosyltransferase family 2 protein [Nisaea acidiphila]|uniref:Glycosyltransferase family 2 protein n=1 Tax=Nisaea acidiphila TaxID=1862145 RepID=A0A9J7ATE1_9PROT|nr:glycosyltransferase family 2 protein [Nisaea acidiphila]UUX49596.1 glycosyltransferase family 2 protein [Nisaea acidiphila]
MTETGAPRNAAVADAAAPTIAVLVPCYNEEATVAKVVGDFQTALPGAEIHVYDNNSTDRTSEIAASAGAIVGFEGLAGKGNVVRRMFSDVEADIYVLVDGDATYSSEMAPQLIAMLTEKHLDMVVGARVSEEAESYRFGHRFGNLAFTSLVAWIFGNRFTDLFSGYRVFSRRFVKTFPALSTGFEIETELTVHALELNMPIGEIETPYLARPEGSTSKLNTIRDGIRILYTIVMMLRDERPLATFGLTGLLLVLLSVILAVPLVSEYLATGLVPRLPTAILCTGMMLLGWLSCFCGLTLESLRLGRREAKRLAYLATDGVSALKRRASKKLQ